MRASVKQHLQAIPSAVQKEAQVTGLTRWEERARNGELILHGHTWAQPAHRPAFPPSAPTGPLQKVAHIPDQKGSAEKLRKSQNGKKVVWRKTEKSGEVTEKKSKSEKWSDWAIAAWAEARKSSYLMMKHKTCLKILERAEGTNNNIFDTKHGTQKDGLINWFVKIHAPYSPAAFYSAWTIGKINCFGLFFLQWLYFFFFFGNVFCKNRSIMSCLHSLSGSACIW